MAGPWVCLFRIYAPPMSNNAWADLTISRQCRLLIPPGRRREGILAIGRTGTTDRFLEISPHGNTASLEGAGRSDVVFCATIGFRLPADISGSVRELARRSGATLFSTLLAAFQVTLSRWTGAEDIVVGTPVANRTSQDVRETMGYFSGVVPLRGQVEREPSVFRAFTNCSPIHSRFICKRDTVCRTRPGDRRTSVAKTQPDF